MRLIDPLFHEKRIEKQPKPPLGSIGCFIPGIAGSLTHPRSENGLMTFRSAVSISIVTFSADAAGAAASALPAADTNTIIAAAALLPDHFTPKSPPPKRRAFLINPV